MSQQPSSPSITHFEQQYQALQKAHQRLADARRTRTMYQRQVSHPGAGLTPEAQRQYCAPYVAQVQTRIEEVDQARQAVEEAYAALTPADRAQLPGEYWF